MQEKPTIKHEPIPSNLAHLEDLPPQERLMEAFNITEAQLTANRAGTFAASQRIRTYAGPVILALVLLAIGSIPIVIFLTSGEVDLILGIGLPLMMLALAGFLLFPVVKGLQASIHHAEGMVQPRIVNTQLNHSQSVTGYVLEIEGDTYAMTKKQYYGFIPGEVYRIHFVPTGMGSLGVRGQIISTDYVGQS